jgi:hypothetical protein
MTFDFTTEGQVRKAFWQGMPTGVQVRGKRQNGYNATIRSEWVEFVDMLQKNGHISEALAERVTL